MHDPPDVKDYLSGLRKTPVRGEKISERQQENMNKLRTYKTLVQFLYACQNYRIEETFYES